MTLPRSHKRLRRHGPIRYKRPRPESRRDLKARLDRRVSQKVRERERVCVTCGESDEQKLTASHFYSRQWLAVRYSPVNVHTQCKTCNQAHSMNCQAYLAFMLDTYDEETMRALDEARLSQKRFTDDELRQMLKELGAG